MAGAALRVQRDELQQSLAGSVEARHLLAAAPTGAVCSMKARYLAAHLDACRSVLPKQRPCYAEQESATQVTLLAFSTKSFVLASAQPTPASSEGPLCPDWWHFDVFA